MVQLLYVNIAGVVVKLVKGQLEKGSQDVYVDAKGGFLGGLNDYVFLSKQSALQFLTHEYDYRKALHYAYINEHSAYSVEDVTMLSQLLALSLAVQILEF